MCHLKKFQWITTNHKGSMNRHPPNTEISSTMRTTFITSGNLISSFKLISKMKITNSTNKSDSLPSTLFNTRNHQGIRSYFPSNPKTWRRENLTSGRNLSFISEISRYPTKKPSWPFSCFEKNSNNTLRIFNLISHSSWKKLLKTISSK